MNAVVFSHVYKTYRLGPSYQPSLRDYLSKFFYRQKLIHQSFDALKNISFSIKQGESVGLIGPNGAGKSTILKLICRVIEPRSGKIKVNGKVAGLLELGGGFHPELTGKENIFFQGAILGMKQKKIKKHYEEIVAFSGVEEFLDTPVKYYSSGMLARLGFSVAVHTDPDIFLVDEALAVGDQEFRHKCIQKMKELTNKENMTLVFVSHALAQLKILCQRIIWLDHGEIMMDGKVKTVIDRYLESIQR